MSNLLNMPMALCKLEQLTGSKLKSWLRKETNVNVRFVRKSVGPILIFDLNVYSDNVLSITTLLPECVDFQRRVL
ncbi:MAG: hypothetical protein ACI94O_001897 [Octadecabacter sp.]|jgi:hypothetical protein